MTCKAITDALLDGDAGAVAAYGARFSGVAFPGETLNVAIWKDSAASGGRSWPPLSRPRATTP